MNNVINFKDNCKEETLSAWLVSVMQFGLKIKMKEVKHSVYQKFIVNMMSVVIGQLKSSMKNLV